VNGHRLMLVSYVGERDGMALELADEAGEPLAEVFEDDATKERTVEFFATSPLPLAEVRWLLDEAERRL